MRSLTDLQSNLPRFDQINVIYEGNLRGANLHKLPNQNISQIMTGLGADLPIISTLTCGRARRCTFVSCRGFTMRAGQKGQGGGASPACLGGVLPLLMRTRTETGASAATSCPRQDVSQQQVHLRQQEVEHSHKQGRNKIKASFFDGDLQPWSINNSTCEFAVSCC